MSLPAILTTLENLVVEVALWVLLVPKTLWRVVKEPTALPTLTSEADAATQSSGEYVSPILLWLLVGVLPLVPLVATKSGGPEWIAHPLMASLGVEPKIASVATLLLMGPLAIAAAQTLMARKVFSRQSLRTPFAVQCGCFAPLLFLYALALHARVLAVVTPYDWILEPLSIALLICGALWFLVAELLLLRTELYGAWRAVSVLLFGLLLWFVLVLASKFALLILGVFFS
jgi:hypothetical protein